MVGLILQLTINSQLMQTQVFVKRKENEYLLLFGSNLCLCQGLKPK